MKASTPAIAPMLFALNLVLIIPFFSIAKNNNLKASCSRSSGSVGLTAPKAAVPQLSIQLYIPQGNIMKNIDGAKAFYSDAYNAGVDWMDATKAPNINEGIGLLRDGTILSFERRPLVVVADTLFLDLTKMTSMAYQFQITGSNWTLPTNLTCTFIDKYLNTTTPIDLAGTTTVNFNVLENDASAVSDRFMIVFTPLNVVPVLFNSVEASKNETGTVVNWKVSSEEQVAYYKVLKSTDGISFQLAGVINATTSNIYQLIDKTEDAFYYKVISVDNNGNKNYSSIVRVKPVVTNYSICLIENNSGTGIFKFNNMPAGVYTIRLLTMSGQQIIEKRIQFSGGTSNVSINFGTPISKGINFVEIISIDKTSPFFKVMLFQ